MNALTINENGVAHFTSPEAVNASMTQAVVVHQENQAQGLETVTDPGVLVPTVVGAALIIGGALGYYFGGWRKRRGENRQPPEIAEAPGERSISHQGSALVLKNLLANVTLETDPQAATMELTVTGKQRRLDKLKANPIDGTLTLSQGHSGNGLRGYMLIELASVTNWDLLAKFVHSNIAKKLGIEIVDKSDVLEITGKVPEGNSLAITGINGVVVARGNYGWASVESSYSKNVTIGSVTGARVNADTSSRVRFGAVHGPMDVVAGYNAQVIIDGGIATPLKAELDTSCGLYFSGEARGLKLKTGYNAVAQINRATGSVSMETDTSSKATVDGGNADSVTIDAEYNSQAVFNGMTKRARMNLDTSSFGQIGRVDDLLEAATEYNAVGKVLMGDVGRAFIEADTSSRVYITGVVRSGKISAEYGAVVQAGGYGESVIFDQDSGGRIVKN